jgi:hypothetical protein
MMVSGEAGKLRRSSPAAVMEVRGLVIRPLCPRQKYRP